MTVSRDVMFSLSLLPATSVSQEDIISSQVRLFMSHLFHNTYKFEIWYLDQNPSLDIFNARYCIWRCSLGYIFWVCSEIENARLLLLWESLTQMLKKFVTWILKIQEWCILSEDGKEHVVFYLKLCQLPKFRVPFCIIYEGAWNSSQIWYIWERKCKNRSACQHDILMFHCKLSTMVLCFPQAKWTHISQPSHP